MAGQFLVRFSERLHMHHKDCLLTMPIDGNVGRQLLVEFQPKESSKEFRKFWRISQTHRGKKRDVWPDTFFVWPANLKVTFAGSSASNDRLPVLGPGNSLEEGEPEVVRRAKDGAGVVKAPFCLGERPRRRCGAGSQGGVAMREGAIAASEPGSEAFSWELEAADGNRPAAPAGSTPELASAAADGATRGQPKSLRRTGVLG